MIPPGYEGTLGQTPSGAITVNIAAAGKKIADELKAITVKDSIYYYSDGLYHADERYVEVYVTRWLMEAGITTGTTSLTRELMAVIRSRDWRDRYPFDQQPNIIPCRNGVVRIEDDHSISFTGYQPDHLCTRRLDVEYNPDIGTEDTVAKTIAEWMDDDEARVSLIQIPALAIMQSWGHVWKLAFLLEGKTNAGKSTYCDMLTRFFARDNCGRVELADLTKNRFIKAALAGKYINIQDDLSSVPLTNLGRFKDLTGTHEHNIERKGKDSVPGYISAMHLYTCNGPPSVSNPAEQDDEAFWKRWNYLSFTNQFEVDPNIKEFLSSDSTLSGLLNLVIAEIIEILKDRTRIYRMTADEVKQTWTMAVDHVAQYISQNYIREPTATIPKDELYEHYAEWCSEHGHTAFPKAQMTTALSRMNVTTTQLNRKGKRIRAYRGLSPTKPVNNTPKSIWTPLDDHAIKAERYLREAYPDNPDFAGPILIEGDDGEYYEVNEE